MKKKKLLYIACLLIPCLLLSNSFAQEYASQWHLPEGAKARLGRGKLNNIIFSPDSTRVAVPTSIGIWVYDAHTTEAVSFFSEIQTGEIDKYLPTESPESLTFSADALIMASAHGNRITSGILQQAPRLRCSTDIPTQLKHSHFHLTTQNLPPQAETGLCGYGTLGQVNISTA